MRGTPSHFHVGGRRAGTTIRFRLDRASSVTLSFERVLTGHHKGPRCLTSQKRGTRCTILRSAGHLTIHNGRAGTNTVRFSGRLAGKALAPGSYRATATPTGGDARTTQLTILRPHTKSTP